MKIRYGKSEIMSTLDDQLSLQITPSKETMLAWQNRPQKLVAEYIKRSLLNNGSDVERKENYNLPPLVNVYEDEPRPHLSDRFRSDSLNMA